MTCVLFSGGWDSAACVIKYQHLNPDLIFFNYGQNYLNNELAAARDFALHFNLTLKVIDYPLGHDFQRRNFHLITQAQRLGYKTIIIGARNLIPLTDPYKDSNWWSLRCFGRLMGIRLLNPMVGRTKRYIVRFVRSHYSGQLYNCYNNKTDIATCDCRNCRELQRLAF